MKQILLSLVLLNPFFVKAQDPCDGPAGCPIYEHIKDEGEHMLEQFMGAAVVVLVVMGVGGAAASAGGCLLYTSPSPRDKRQSRMPSSA